MSDIIEQGNKAPWFECPNQNGDKICLTDFAGQKLVLYFYPKDDTSGCSAQACNLSDNYKSLQDAGYTILGISPDSPETHIKFIKKFNLPFQLLSDTDHKVAEDYGVWKEKNMYGRKYMGIIRTTFIIDEAGQIAQIIKKVQTKDHASQILKSYL